MLGLAFASTFFFLKRMTYSLETGSCSEKHWYLLTPALPFYMSIS